MKVINDNRRVSTFVSMDRMWSPLVRAGRNVAGITMKVRGVRARYFNQDTCEVEEVELVELLNMEGGGFTTMFAEQYLFTIYAHIRCVNGEELHVQGSLICTRNENGFGEPNYIF